MRAASNDSGRLYRWLRLALRSLTLLAGVALALMMFITVADVLLRNLFAIPILGTYDMVETLMVFVVFLGIGEAFLDDTHITVDVIDHFIGQRTLCLLKIIALVFAAVFLALLLRFMPIPAWEAYVYADRKPDLPILLAWLWIPCLLGIFAAFLAVLFKLFCHLRRPFGDSAAVSTTRSAE